MEKEIYIVRHGQTEYNRKNIIQGKGVNLGLNDTGKAQAEAFYSAYADVPFDVVYTSTLKRSQESVAGFIQKGIEWREDYALDEIGWGVMEGQPSTEDNRRRFAAMVDRWHSGHLDERIDGGESPNEIASRQKKLIDEISKLEVDRVLICSHGRAMRVLMCSFLDLPLTEMAQFNHKNLCLYKLRYKNERYELELGNCRAHLERLPIQ